MKETIHLLPLTDREVLLIVAAINVLLEVYETPAFGRIFQPQVIKMNKKEAEELKKKLKNTK